MRSVASWLSLALIFVIPWENVISIGDLGTTGARAVGLGVAAIWIITLMATGRLRRPAPFHVAVYIFVLWNALSLIWTIDFDLTITRVLTYLQLAILVFVLWDLYTTPKLIRVGLQAYVFGAYVAIASTIANYFSGIQTSYGRYAATGFNSNNLGFILALGIPLAWHLADTAVEGKKTNILKVVNYGYLPAATLAILLTASRGAFVAAIPAFVFCIASLVSKKSSARLPLIVVIVVSVLAIFSIVPSSSIERLATTSTSISEGDFGGRAEIWRDGFAAFSEHPLLGVGSGAFGAALESGRSAHNSFLSVLVEVGLVGLILFAVVLALAIYASLRQPKRIAALWLTVLLVWFIGSNAGGRVARKPTWLFLGLVTASAAVYMPKQRATREEYLHQWATEDLYGSR